LIPVDPQTAPLSPAEADELMDLMSSDAVPEHCMDPSMLDGYLTALVSGPRVLPIAAWLPSVWDPVHCRDEADFARASDAQRLVELLVRHANATEDMLSHEPEAFEPLFDGAEPDEAVGRAAATDPAAGTAAESHPDAWCFGYLQAIALDAAQWEPVLQAHPEWFANLRLYGSEAGWQELERRPVGPDEDEAHRQRVASLAPAARSIHAWWRARRPALQLVAPPLVQTVHASKVGRNAPCPCGSGKKFKHCHAAAGR
jgi:uncharacterized protein